MARWPVIAPYINSRKRINDYDSQATHGIYDDDSIKCRVVYVSGYLIATISKMWLESERVKELSEEQQKPWGAYPPLPTKKKL